MPKSLAPSGKTGAEWHHRRHAQGTSSSPSLPYPPSLRAQRSNPESLRGRTLDCFVARAPRNDEWRKARLTPLTPPAASGSRAAG
nr:hypothetical protein FNV92_05865 [Bradyrhizobium cosmicum]